MQDEDLIEAYLNETLSKESRKNFEKRLESDVAFRKSFEEHRSFVFALEADYLKSFLEKEHDKLVDSSPKKTSASLAKLAFPKYAIAASLSLIFFALAWFYSKDNSAKNELFSEFAQLDMGLPTVMSTSKNMVFDEGMVAYRNDEFRAAIDIWQQIIPKNDTMFFYLGNAYLGIEEYNNAQKYFEKAFEVENSQYRQKSDWYLALLAYRKGKTERLSEIAATKNHKFWKEAVKLKENVAGK